jgi:hypothetical protein
LEPGVGIVHGGGRSEIFRAEHGDDQVDEEGDGEEADEDDFHGRKAGGGDGLQRTFSQKRAYAALRTKKSTEAATKMRSFMTTRRYHGRVLTPN